jgi:TIR domain
MKKLCPRIFISHRHKDRDLGNALVELLRAAFDTETDDILCTSAQSHMLRGGREPTQDQIRRAISNAQVVLGILTPDTKESSYVLMELGASWGQKKHCFPLLAKGAKRADIASPISDLVFFQPSDGRQCHQLIEDLHNVAKLKPQKGVSAQIEEKVTNLVRRAGVARGARRQIKPLGLKITDPEPGQAVGDRDFPVEGRFDKRAPSGTFRVFITNFDGTKIWPQKEVEFYPEKHTWKAKATLLDDPPNKAYILIAKFGDVGKLLYDYYSEVGKQKDVWIPLSGLTPDTEICDRVFVRNGWRGG